MGSKTDLNGGDDEKSKENPKSEKIWEVKDVEPEEEVLISKKLEKFTMEDSSKKDSPKKDSPKKDSPEKTPEVKKMTFMEKIKFVTSNITVEPILACYIIPSVFSGLATQNLNLEKACRVNLNYSEEICNALSTRQTSNYTFEEQSVQKLVAHMSGYKSALTSVLSCLLILFWGSWSDRHRRRKPCMMIPIVGELFAVTGLLVCTYFKNIPVGYTVFVDAFFPAISGGWFTAMMGFFSYIGDVSSKDQRTLRIGILNLCFSLGIPIGMAFSGVMLKIIGFYGIFSISFCLYAIGLLYGIFVVKEPVYKDKPKASEITDKGVIADFFDKKHIVNTFKVVFKKGENQRRKRVLVLLTVLMVVIGPLFGEMAVMYLFTRFRFNWSEVDYSLFSTFGMITHLIGASFSVGVFSHMLKMDDALIGVISSMSKICSGFVFAFAVTTWQVYIGPVVELLNGTSFTAMRSIASKLVESDELGKINSIFGFVEALMPLIYAPMYTSIYAATLTTFPGAFFLVGSALTVPSVIIFSWMYTVHRRENRIKALEDEKNVKNGINGDKKDITKLETEDEQIKQDTFKQMSINETLDSEIPL